MDFWSEKVMIGAKRDIRASKNIVINPGETVMVTGHTFSKLPENSLVLVEPSNCFIRRGILPIDNICTLQSTKVQNKFHVPVLLKNSSLNSV